MEKDYIDEFILFRSRVAEENAMNARCLLNQLESSESLKNMEQSEKNSFIDETVKEFGSFLISLKSSSHINEVSRYAADLAMLWLQNHQPEFRRYSGLSLLVELNAIDCDVLYDLKSTISEILWESVCDGNCSIREKSAYLIGSLVDEMFKQDVNCCSLYLSSINSAHMSLKLTSTKKIHGNLLILEELLQRYEKWVSKTDSSVQFDSKTDNSSILPSKKTNYNQTDSKKDSQVESNNETDRKKQHFEAMGNSLRAIFDTIIKVSDFQDFNIRKLAIKLMCQIACILETRMHNEKYVTLCMKHIEQACKENEQFEKKIGFHELSQINLSLLLEMNKRESKNWDIFLEIFNDELERMLKSNIDLKLNQKSIYIYFEKIVKVISKSQKLDRENEIQKIIERMLELGLNPSLIGALQNISGYLPNINPFIWTSVLKFISKVLQNSELLEYQCSDDIRNSQLPSRRSSIDTIKSSRSNTNEQLTISCSFSFDIQSIKKSEKNWVNFLFPQVPSMPNLENDSQKNLEKIVYALEVLGSFLHNENWALILTDETLGFYQDLKELFRITHRIILNCFNETNRIVKIAVIQACFELLKDILRITDTKCSSTHKKVALNNFRLGEIFNLLILIGKTDSDKTIRKVIMSELFKAPELDIFLVSSSRTYFCEILKDQDNDIQKYVVLILARSYVHDPIFWGPQINCKIYELMSLIEIESNILIHETDQVRSEPNQIGIRLTNQLNIKSNQNRDVDAGHVGTEWNRFGVRTDQVKIELNLGIEKTDQIKSGTDLQRSKSNCIRSESDHTIKSNQLDVQLNRARSELGKFNCDPFQYDLDLSQYSSELNRMRTISDRTSIASTQFGPVAQRSRTEPNLNRFEELNRIRAESKLLLNSSNHKKSELNQWSDFNNLTANRGNKSIELTRMSEYIQLITDLLVYSDFELIRFQIESVLLSLCMNLKTTLEVSNNSTTPQNEYDSLIVTTLSSLGRLSTIGGHYLLSVLDCLIYPVIFQLLTSCSSLTMQETAMCILGEISSNTGLAKHPYSSQFSLYDTLLGFLKKGKNTLHPSLQHEVLKIFAILGFFPKKSYFQWTLDTLNLCGNKDTFSKSNQLESVQYTQETESDGFNVDQNYLKKDIYNINLNRESSFFFTSKVYPWNCSELMNDGRDGIELNCASQNSSEDEYVPTLIAHKLFEILHDQDFISVYEVAIDTAVKLCVDLYGSNSSCFTIQSNRFLILFSTMIGQDINIDLRVHLFECMPKIIQLLGENVVVTARFWITKMVKNCWNSYPVECSVIIDSIFQAIKCVESKYMLPDIVPLWINSLCEEFSSERPINRTKVVIHTILRCAESVENYSNLIISNLLRILGNASFSQDTREFSLLAVLKLVLVNIQLRKSFAYTFVRDLLNLMKSICDSKNTLELKGNVGDKIQKSDNFGTSENTLRLSILAVHHVLGSLGIESLSFFPDTHKIILQCRLYPSLIEHCDALRQLIGSILKGKKHLLRENLPHFFELEVAVRTSVAGIVSFQESRNNSKSNSKSSYSENVRKYSEERYKNIVGNEKNFKKDFSESGKKNLEENITNEVVSAEIYSKQMLKAMGFRHFQESETELCPIQEKLCELFDTKKCKNILDWNYWFSNLKLGVLQNSTSQLLSDCLPLAQVHEKMIDDLFNAAFLSIWEFFSEELMDHDENIFRQNFRAMIVDNIENALFSKKLPQLILIQLLGLVEYMELKKKSIPLKSSILMKRAIEVRKFALYVYYAEKEYTEMKVNCREGQRLKILGNLWDQSEENSQDTSYTCGNWETFEKWNEKSEEIFGTAGENFEKFSFNNKSEKSAKIIEKGAGKSKQKEEISGKFLEKNNLISTNSVSRNSESIKKKSKNQNTPEKFLETSIKSHRSNKVGGNQEKIPKISVNSSTGMNENSLDFSRNLQITENLITAYCQLGLKEAAEGLLKNSEVLTNEELEYLDPRVLEKLGRYQEAFDYYTQELEKSGINDENWVYAQSDEDEAINAQTSKNIPKRENTPVDKKGINTQSSKDKSICSDIVSQFYNAEIGKLRCMYELGNESNLLIRAIELSNDFQKCSYDNMLPFDCNKWIAEINDLGAKACFSLGNWTQMDHFTKKENVLEDVMCDTQTDGSFYKMDIILAIKNGDLNVGKRLIEKEKNSLYPLIESLFEENMSRAYPCMIALQELNDLEDVVNFKQKWTETDQNRLHLPGNDRSSIKIIQNKVDSVGYDQLKMLKLKWFNRFRMVSDDLSVWRNLMNIHSLVLSPEEDMDSWVKYASISRKQGNYPLSALIFGKLGVEFSENMLFSKKYPEISSKPAKIFNKNCELHPKIVYNFNKLVWQVGCHKEAMSGIKNLIENLNEKVPVTEESNHWLVKSLLIDVQWQLVHLDHQSTDEVDASLKDHLIQSVTKAKDLSSTYKTWNIFAKLNAKFAKFDKSHVPHAISGFFNSLSYSSSQRKIKILQDTLELLNLWYEFGDEEAPNRAMELGIEACCVDTWLSVVPQLIARIHTGTPRVNMLLKRLILQIAKLHPQALVYPIVAGSKSSAHPENSAISEILAEFSRLDSRLIQETQFVCEELVQVAITPAEIWYEGLEEASRLRSGGKNLNGMLKCLKALHHMGIDDSTVRGVQFVHTFGRDLDEALDWLMKFESTQSESDMHQAWNIYYQVYRKISVQLAGLKKFHLNQISPKLVQKGTNMKLSVPGTYRAHREIIRIQRFDSIVKVVSWSKQRPRRVNIRSTLGNTHPFLLKGHEDLRQDERIMQVFGLINSMLESSPKSSKSDLKIFTYSIVPISRDCGLVEWLNSCETLHSLIKGHRESNALRVNSEQRFLTQIAPEYDRLPVLNKLEAFERACAHTDGQDLNCVLWRSSTSAEDWIFRRTNYTHSLAVMSMAGYIIGLGDRHPSNIMLDRKTGKIVHIDFGDSFEVAMQREKFPEKIPFRLTRMLIHAMEVTGVNGTFRDACECVMDVLRGNDNKNSLLNMLNVFVYDPLGSWHTVQHSASNAYESTTSEVESFDISNLDQKEEVNLSRIGLENESWEDKISHKWLYLHLNIAEISSTKQQLPLYSNEYKKDNSRAIAILERICKKLNGDVCANKNIVHTDVKKQVDLLISQATSDENLCQLYSGWIPFW